MSAALKFASIATGFTFFGASALYSFKSRNQDFSKNALALEHTYETQTGPLGKPKLYVSILLHRYRWHVVT